MQHLPTIFPRLPPPSEGLLPYWLLVTAAASIYNAAQNYFISWQTKEIYSRKEAEVTPLAARFFAAWTGVSGFIRLFAAFHIRDPPVYFMALSVFLVALWHFTSEWLIFRSIKLNRGSSFPLIIANFSTIWMFTQMGYYLSLSK